MSPRSPPLLCRFNVATSPLHLKAVAGYKLGMRTFPSPALLRMYVPFPHSRGSLWCLLWFDAQVAEIGLKGTGLVNSRQQRGRAAASAADDFDMDD